MTSSARRKTASRRSNDPTCSFRSLAASLNNLANRLTDLGRREPALEAAQEAVDLYRRLAAARPDVFMPDLAMSLNNLANMLSDLGRREAALEAAQEAVELYRQLAAARPDVFIPDLAMSLNNLASLLSDLGRREPALEAAQEAVGLYRQRAAARPDVFVPDLARSPDRARATHGGVGADGRGCRVLLRWRWPICTPGDSLHPAFLDRPEVHRSLMGAMLPQ